jgi:cellulose biosynthesis protein BcsQ
MSRFLNEVREAAQRSARRPSNWEGFGADQGGRTFQVVTVTSNKGGVGKTTVATNLPVYVRALREDLPILALGLDDQPMPDRMFALRAELPRSTMTTALRSGSFKSAIRMGQYGVHYVPASSDICELKREIWEPSRLETVLRRSDWHGLVVIDTKSDLEILTRNAIAASDLVIVVVKDFASLIEAGKVFALMEKLGRPRARARVLLSMMDLRVRYREGAPDVLALLQAEIERRGYPIFENHLSHSVKIESLHTNPEWHVHSILHGAPGSVVHRQMHGLTLEVLAALECAEIATEAVAPRCDQNAGQPREQLL